MKETELQLEKSKRKLTNILDNITDTFDISKQKQAEIAARESHERFESLVIHSPEMISVHDGEICLYINPAGVKILGAKSQDEIVGKSIWNFILEEDYSQVQTNAMKVMNGEENTISSQRKLKQINGTIIDTDIIVSKIIYADKPAILAIVRDITEQKKIDEMLRTSEKLSVVGQLAAGVAHEVRNPLTAVKGFLQLAKVTKEYNDMYTDIMLDELIRVESIIYEFLALAKPHKRKSFEKKDVQLLLNQVITLLYTQALIRNVEIITELNEIPFIECEENLLKQVLINLLQNAIESLNERGTVKITLTQIDEHHVSITIQDDGCGIAEDCLPHLGEPFYTSKDKGTGLGLMISYQIIEQHRGKLHFTSQLGVGTTVVVVLPIDQHTFNYSTP